MRNSRRRRQLAAHVLLIFVGGMGVALLGGIRIAAAGGQLDGTFGSSGVATIGAGPWGDRFLTHGAAPSFDAATPDAVVVVGVAAQGTTLGTYSAAVDATGALLGPSTLGLGDATAYGAFTRILADPTDAAHRLYVAGHRYVAGATPPYAFLVGRLTANGNGVDPAWGSGAPVVTPIAGASQAAASALALQPDGMLVVAGGANAGGDVAVARYDATGALDPLFGSGGTTVISGGLVSAIAVQADGKILLAGFFVDGDFGGFGVMRLLSNGALDPDFGVDFGVPGIASRGFRSRYTEGVALGVRALADGRIVAAGSDWDPYARRGSFVATRYLADGTVDSTFGVARGRIRKRVGKSNAGGAVAFRADGRILIAGTARRRHPEYHSDVALLQLTPDGRPDRAFGRAGKVQTQVVADAEGFGVRDVVVDSLGRAVVVGESGDGTRRRPCSSATCPRNRFSPPDAQRPSEGPRGSSCASRRPVSSMSPDGATRNSAQRARA